jgi:ankyrin repeat protein
MRKSNHKRSLPSAPRGLSVPRMTQFVAMKTDAYVAGVEKLNGDDAWAMFTACAAGDLPRVKNLLAKDRRLVNAQIYYYQFPIHMAVRAGHAEIVKLLLDQGTDPITWNDLLNTARERGRRPIEDMLLRAMTKRFNYSPAFDELKEAIIARDSRKVDSVLRRQPKLAQASDAAGNNALHWSVMTRQLDLIDRFAALGTPIDAQRTDGFTPILLAVNGGCNSYRAARDRLHLSIRNKFVIVGYLLARGAKYTISVAAAVGDQERIEELLRKDPGLANGLDSARKSPLSHASQGCYLHIVRLLLERGADPNIPEGDAPDGLALYLACAGNHLEVAKLLLEHGANPHAGLDSCMHCVNITRVHHGDQAKPMEELMRSHGASTQPYHMTVRQFKQALRDGHEVTRHPEFLGNLMGQRNAKLLELFLDSVPNAVDRIGDELACPWSPALVRKVLARGLDPNRPDWLGRTFLHACAASGNRPIAAVFLDAGADINARALEFHETPLAAAVRAGQGSQEPDLVERRRLMVEFLLKRGAATNLPDDEPWATPLAWARKFGLADIEEILVKHGAT